MKVCSFSVSMCVYHGDNPDCFAAAVDSVFNQTIPPDEVVLVVDGPVSLELDEVICRYEKIPSFRVVRLKENRGHGEARRIGLKHCTHELVALMDADDICVADRFEKQLAVFESDPAVSIVGGHISEFANEQNLVTGYRKVKITNSEICQDIRKRCPMNQVTVMFRKEDVLMAGGYLDWYCNEDYYLWVRMYLKKMKFANVDSVLVKVRIGEDMYRRRGGWKYFVSEWKLQNLLLSNKIIDLITYGINVAKRLVVQVLLPNRIRGFIFQKFARTSRIE